MSLRACDHCDGLIPPARRRCPHCDRPGRPRRGALRWIARTACAGGALVTLMACYGMMRPYGPDHAGDGDGDGVPAPTDCDDARPDVYPGAADLEGDGVDQSCDGVDGWRDPSAPPPAPSPALATDPAAPALATDPAAPPPPIKAIAVDPPAAAP